MLDFGFANSGLDFEFVILGLNFTSSRQGHLTLDFVGNYLILENPLWPFFSLFMSHTSDDVQMENADYTCNMDTSNSSGLLLLFCNLHFWILSFRARWGSSSVGRAHPSHG